MNNVKLETKQEKTNDPSAYQYQRFGKKHGPEKMILCDTNIFIEAFKNNPSATKTHRCIGFQNISLSAVALMELYFGAFNKLELAKIKSRMKPLETLILDRSITNRCH